MRGEAARRRRLPQGHVVRGNVKSKRRLLRVAVVRSGSRLTAGVGCDFNRSLQHLDSITRAGGVADEEEKVLH